MIGGLLFTGLHLTEWFNMITKEHFTITANPEGTPLFGAVFFGITGLHMTHVMIGVIYLGIVAVGYGRGNFPPKMSKSTACTGTSLTWSGCLCPLIYLDVGQILGLLESGEDRTWTHTRTPQKLTRSQRRIEHSVWIGLVAITGLEVSSPMSNCSRRSCSPFWSSCRWSRRR